MRSLKKPLALLLILVLATALSGCIAAKEDDPSAPDADRDADAGSPGDDDPAAAGSDEDEEAPHREQTKRFQGVQSGTGEDSYVFGVQDTATRIEVQGEWTKFGTGEIQLIDPQGDVKAEIDGPGYSAQLMGDWVTIDDPMVGEWTLLVDGPGVAVYTFEVTY